MLYPIEAVRALLINDAAVFAITGAGWYPVRLPQKPTFPAGVLQTVNGADGYAMTGPTGLNDHRVQLDLYAETQEELEALRRAVNGLLSGFSGTVSAGSPAETLTIQGAFKVSEQDFQADPSEGSVLLHRLLRKSIDYNIWIEE